MLNDLVRLQLTFRQTVIKFIIIKLSNIFNIIKLYNIDNYKISTLTVRWYSGMSSRQGQGNYYQARSVKRHDF